MDEQVSAQRARLEDEAEALVSSVAETDVTQGHSLWSSSARPSEAGFVWSRPGPEGSRAKTYQAEITVVNRIVDSAIGTFGVRLEMPNPKHALPAGLACTVKFPVMP